MRSQLHIGTRRRWFGGAMIALLLVLALAAAIVGNGMDRTTAPSGVATLRDSTNTSNLATATPIVVAFRAGTGTIEAAGWRFTASSVETPPVLRYATIDVIEEERPSSRWLVIIGQLTNLGSAPRDLDRSAFQVLDSGGAVYDPSTAPVVAKHAAYLGVRALPLSQLPPGVAIPVLLVFDVSWSGDDFQLVLRQGNQPHLDLEP